MAEQVLAALFVLVPFCYLASSYVPHLVIEHATGARHLQLLSGCPPLAYWAGSYTWDLATHAIVCAASMGIFAAYGDSSVVGSASKAAGSFLLFFMYGAAAIALTQCYSFGFESPSAAQVRVFCMKSIKDALQVVVLEAWQINLCLELLVHCIILLVGNEGSQS